MVQLVRPPHAIGQYAPPFFQCIFPSNLYEEAAELTQLFQFIAVNTNGSHLCNRQAILQRITLTMMSVLWPHTAYAEDQNNYHAILATHVLFRGFQAGSIVGSVAGPVYYLIRRRALVAPQLFPTIVRSTGVGAVIGTGVMAVVLPLRMWGREEIEWRDRSWRLLENKGQVEVDTFSTVGLVGAATALAAENVRSAGTRLTWKTATGSAGLGSTIGILGYMGWRYGMNKGKWPE